MIDARFVPIENWPGEKTPHYKRLESPFSATYSATLDLLERELFQLGAKEIIVQAAFSRDQLRNDGWPRSGSRPFEPGIVLQFRNRKGERFSFPCDRFKTFEANMRAIALSLEALRKVDRYGVTRSAEQYQGWRQIEAPGAQPSFSSAEQAARFLAGHAYSFEDAPSIRAVLIDPEARKAAYRRAASKLHPDQSSGSNEMFIRLRQALAVLEAQ